MQACEQSFHIYSTLDKANVRCLLNSQQRNKHISRLDLEAQSDILYLETRYLTWNHMVYQQEAQGTYNWESPQPAIGAETHGN